MQIAQIISVLLARLRFGIYRLQGEDVRVVSTKISPAMYLLPRHVTDCPAVGLIQGQVHFTACLLIMLPFYSVHNRTL